MEIRLLISLKIQELSQISSYFFLIKIKSQSSRLLKLCTVSLFNHLQLKYMHISMLVTQDQVVVTMLFIDCPCKLWAYFDNSCKTKIPNLYTPLKLHRHTCKNKYKIHVLFKYMISLWYPMNEIFFVSSHFVFSEKNCFIFNHTGSQKICHVIDFLKVWRRRKNHWCLSSSRSDSNSKWSR